MSDIKKRILSSAVKHFVKDGYAGSSVRDICSDAGASMSAIHYHFGSKEGLFRQIFERFGQMHASTLADILDGPETLEEFKLKIQLYIETILRTMAEDLDTFTIVDREIKVGNPIARSFLEDKYLTFINEFISFLERGKKKKYLKKSVDSFELGWTIMNLVSSLARSNELNEKYFKFTIKNKDFQKKWIANTLSIIFHGALEIKE